MSGFYGKCIFFALLGFTLSFLSLRAEQVAAPTFSQPTGTYHTPVTITLECATPGARMFYTLDGSEPTTNATLYRHGRKRLQSDLMQCPLKRVQ